MKADGVFGLGYKSSNIFPSILDFLKEKGKIDKRIFGLDLSGIKGKKGSRIILGGWHKDIESDRSKFEWVKVSTNAEQWEFQPEYLYIGNKTYGNVQKGKKNYNIIIEFI